MGERKALIYPDGTHASYEYDETVCLSKFHTPTGEISYAYDKAGRLCEKQLSHGIVTQYAYNCLGRIGQISHEGENVNERYIYHYDAAGNKVGRTKRVVEAQHGRRVFAAMKRAMLTATYLIAEVIVMFMMP